MLGQAFQVAGGLFQVGALGWLAPGELFQIAGQLFERGFAGVRLGIKFLLQSRFGGGEIGQRFLAVAGVFAQLLLQLGQLPLKLGALFGGKRIVFGNLFLQLINLLINVLYRFLYLPPFGQNSILRIGNNQQRCAKRQRYQANQQALSVNAQAYLVGAQRLGRARSIVLLFLAQGIAGLAGPQL